MIVSFKKTYICQHIEGDFLVARQSPNGWYWERNKLPYGSIVPEEHLGKMQFVMEGSMKQGWSTESVYEVESCRSSMEEHGQS